MIERTVATFTMTGKSQLGYNAFVNVPKKDKESFDDYEKRTWQDRLHLSPEGTAVVPSMAVIKCLQECAKFLSEKIPGKGQATYTKHFDAGLMAGAEYFDTGIKKEDVPGKWVHVPSDGKKGSGSRVLKCFPQIPAGWKISGDIVILDGTITKEVFKRVFEQAGVYIGIGAFRPRNGGTNGRYGVELTFSTIG